jgi:hypothetical protein
MQRTRRYIDTARVAGGDPAGALAWLRRQAGWEARLAALEADRRAPVVSPRVDTAARAG